MVAAFKVFAPDIFELTKQSLNDGKTDLGFLRLEQTLEET